MKSLYTVILFVLIPLTIHAQEVVINKGIKGIWFDDPTATRLLKDVSELQPLRQELSLIGDKLKLKDELIEYYKADIRMADEVIAEHVASYKEISIALVAEQEKSSDLREQATKWYKSGILWFSVGLVVGSGVATVACVATK